MGKKKDNQQIDDIAKEFNMNQRQRKQFGKFIEGEKEALHRGNLNAKGDFTYAELRQKAKEFINLLG
jgi:hypothetical protein